MSSSNGWLPGRAEARDLALLAGTLGVGLYGFGRTYGGLAYLVVGLLGVALGLLLGVVADRFGAPLLAVAAATVLVFFVAGGQVAFGASALPGPGSAGRLADAAVSGWYDLLTVLPPIGRSGDLMAIPYLLGLVGAVVGDQLARRCRPVWAPLPASLAVLVLSFLFGTVEPASLLVQGAGFAVLALAWLALRDARRPSRPASGAGARHRLRRSGTAVALLAVVAAGASVLGPHLPGAQAHRRLVLRDRVDPPFDPRQLPSPLAEFRRYSTVDKHLLHDKVLFTVSGLPAGALIRLATMDGYDGTVWNVAGVSGGPSGTGAFQRVGEQIPATVTGRPFRMMVRVGQYTMPGGGGQVWLPSAGAVTSVRFGGPDAGQLAGTFRYNRSADAAVTGTGPPDAPRGLRSGDSYTLDVTLPATAYEKPAVDQQALHGGAALPVQLPPLGVRSDALRTAADTLTGSAGGAYDKADKLATTLRTKGFLSDGGAEQAASAPGHALERLVGMVDPTRPMVGNDEQFAALMAVMARSVGLPARVVTGAVMPSAPQADIRGKDVRAWVEVGVDGVGWMPFFPTPATVKKPDQLPQPRPQPVVKNPPRAPSQVHAEPVDAAAGGATTKRQPENRNGAGFPVRAVLTAGAAGSPVLLLAGCAALVVGLKRRRANRRRSSGRPHARMAGGWAELVDLARDTGAVLPSTATRREAAVYLGRSGSEHRPGHGPGGGVAVLERLATDLAVRADAAVFGPGSPGEDEVRRYWQDVDTAARQLAAGIGRGRRLLAAINPVSLLGGRSWRERLKGEDR